jgi:hypothetical protein
VHGLCPGKAYVGFKASRTLVEEVRCETSE